MANSLAFAESAIDLVEDLGVHRKIFGRPALSFHHTPPPVLLACGLPLVTDTDALATSAFGLQQAVLVTHTAAELRSGQPLSAAVWAVSAEDTPSSGSLASERVSSAVSLCSSVSRGLPCSPYRKNPQVEAGRSRAAWDWCSSLFQFRLSVVILTVVVRSRTHDSQPPD